MSSTAVRWHVLADGAELAAALASTVAEKLRAGVDARGGVVLAISGGSTPGKFFEALSREKLDWTKVVVVPVDERFVPPSSDRSNEKLIREKFLVNEARPARFVALYSNCETVEEAARAASRRLAPLPFLIDAAVLGMGLDGHTASFFPDAENPAALLDPLSQKIVMPVHAASAGESRLTLSLARLVESRFLALHIEGEAKRELLLSARRQTGDGALPVEAVFRHSKNPVEIHWAPNEDEIP